MTATYAQVAGVLFAHTAPLLVFGCWRGRVRLRLVLLLCVCWAAPPLWLVWTGHGGIARAVLLGQLMLGGACALTYPFARVAARGNLSAGAAAVFCTTTFALVPAFAVQWPSYALWMPAWAMGLSAYSLLRDAATRAECPSLPTCLRFLWVDPTHVYRDTEAAWNGPVRPSAGRLVRALGFAMLLGALVAWGPDISDRLERGIAAPLAWFTRQYAAHASRAALQIELAALAGATLPVCYRAPWKARSPEDFWRRWNRWIGRWAEVYLYVPTVRALLRGRGARRLGAQDLSLLVVFVVVGLVHDLYLYTLMGQPTLHATLGFATMWGLAAVWRVVTSALSKATVRRTLRARLGHALFVALAYGALFYWEAS